MNEQANMCVCMHGCLSSCQTLSLSLVTFCSLSALVFRSITSECGAGGMARALWTILQECCLRISCETSTRHYLWLIEGQFSCETSSRCSSEEADYRLFIQASGNNCQAAILWYAHVYFGAHPLSVGLPKSGVLSCSFPFMSRRKKGMLPRVKK